MGRPDVVEPHEQDGHDQPLPQLAAKMFDVLAERQINLLAVSSSEIKVSALIAEAELDLAVRVLHTAFGLDAAESQGQAA